MSHALCSGFCVVCLIPSSEQLSNIRAIVTPLGRQRREIYAKRDMENCIGIIRKAHLETRALESVLVVKIYFYLAGWFGVLHFIFYCCGGANLETVLKGKYV